MPTEKPSAIQDIVGLAGARKAFLDAIWGANGWPVRNNANATGTFRLDNPAEAEELRRRGRIPTQGAISGTFVRAEELSIKVVAGGHTHETRAYHLLPSAEPLGRLVIVHHGHGDDFVSGPYRLNETLAGFLERGHAVLAMYMPNYGPAPKTPAGVAALADRHGPIFAQAGFSSPTVALRVFLEPVAACINFLRDNHEYLDFHMVGLSGGGWTTVLCAAADPRIRVSVPVSGSLPLDLRFFGSLGDEEQMHAALFRDTIGYRDLYMLAAYGYGRRHTQILFEQDDCCFSDWQWPPDAPTSLKTELEKYESDIQGRLASRLHGRFDIVRLDDNASIHSMSPQAVAQAAHSIASVAPRTSALCFYATNGLAARSLIRSNGRYAFVGETSVVEPGYSHIVAIGNDHLFLYKTDNGGAVTARLGADAAFSDLMEVSGVGAGWTNVTAVGLEFIFLYNSTSGTAKVGRIDASGAFSEVGPIMTNLSRQWTHTAGASHGGLFLFDSRAGEGLIAQVDSEGYACRGSVRSLPSEWTHVTVVNNNVLFFYNAQMGGGATAIFDPFGNFVNMSQLPSEMPLGATHVVGATNEGLFFLKGTEATGEVWLVDELGEARAVEALAGFGPWTAVTAG